MTLSFLLSIPRRNPRCARGQELLAPATDYYSVLSESEEGGYVRHDFCSACWEASAKQETQQQSKGSWKSRVPAKEAEVLRSADREHFALELLKTALASNSEEDQADAFILALYLTRKRLLQARQQLKQAGGQVVTLYEVVDTEEMLAVKKLPLSQLQVVTLQQRLAEKLKKN